MSSERRCPSRILGIPLLPFAVGVLAPMLALSQAAVAQSVAQTAPQNAAKVPAGSQTAPAAQSAASTQVNHSESYYHYGLAKMYENQAVANGRQDLATQAIEQYKLALGADPDSRVLQDGIANLYFRLGRIREAVSAAQDQVTKHPDDIEAHELLGRVYLRSLGDGQGPQTTDILQAAIKEYEIIVKLKPNDLENRLLLGQLYGLNHNSPKAEEEFQAARQIDGNNEEVVLSMARQYTEQGDLGKAAKSIVEVPPSDRSSRMDFALAGIYDQLKQPKLAAAAYQAALNLDPENTDAKRGLAAALTASGDMNAAGKIYAQILTADPQDPQALIHQAEVQRQQGAYELSLATLKKAQSLISDNNLELSYNVALNEDALGRFDEAVKTLNDMLAYSAVADGKYSDADRSNRALFLDRLGIVEREANRTSDAVAAYKEIAELGGEYQSRGTDGEVDAYRDAHDWAQALQVAAEAAKEMPTSHDVQLTYARQLADSGKVDQGIKLAEAQLNGTPDDRDVLFTLADINVRSKRWPQATQVLDKVEALSTKPEDKVFLYYYRGTVSERQKLYDQAEQEFRKGLAIDPDNAAIENYLGYMLADRGVKLDEAVDLLKKAVAYDPQNGAYLDSLAWAYYKQGQYAMAEDYSRRAVLRLPADPAVRDHLGEIDAKDGKLQQAIVEWQKSLAEYASSLPADIDQSDVDKLQHDLEGARVRLAHAGAAPVK
jgi:tetratricopeptide (TPR) repeat protein